MKTRIMYIEDKSQGLPGPARIGRVEMTKLGKTIYYRGRTFRTLGGRGFKANFYDVETGDEFWISGPRRDGADRLYGGRVPGEIDEDARTEGWAKIRRLPQAKAKERT